MKNIYKLTSDVNIYSTTKCKNNTAKKQHKLAVFQAYKTKAAQKIRNNIE